MASWKEGGIARFVAIEIKTEDGVVSDAQAHFIRAVKRAGGIASVVRDPKELAGLFT
jgi:hypothetical protein